MNWRPIEEAPKDGTWFLGYRPLPSDGTWDRVVVVRWHADIKDFIWPERAFDIYEDDVDLKDYRGEYLHEFYESGGSLTHFMPLPPPPRDTE